MARIVEHLSIEELEARYTLHRLDQAMDKDAVLEMLDRFLTDLAMMREAIRAGDGPTMFDLFSRKGDRA